MGALWVNATLSIAGVSVPTLVSNPVLDLNKREVVLANGTAPSALFGYAPGQANAGFSVRTQAFTGNAASILNSMLNTAGITLAVQEGGVGGASVANCFCTRLEATGSTGGNINVNADFMTLSLPVTGGSVGTASGYGKPFFFSDVVSFTLPGGVKTKVNQFSYVITRRISRYDGNSPSGLPLDLAAAVTTVELTCEYEKLNDSERTAFLANVSCPTLANCIVSITQACAPGASLTLTALNASHHKIPTTVGSNVEDFIKESSLVRADQGSFAIS